MSSILDALRKLEQEKAVVEQPEGVNLRELALEPEFEMAPSHARGRTTGGTIGYAIAGTVVVAGIVAGAVTVAIMMTERSAEEPSIVVASAAVKPPAPESAMQTTVTPLGVLDDELPEEMEPPSKPVITAARTVTPKKAAESPQVKEKPKVDVAKAKPADETPQPPLPSLSNSEPAANVAAVPPPSGKIDFDSLPILTETDRIRLELPPLKINIVGIPNARNPRASALINMQKVYVGENIPSTQARLLDVDLRGVAIDVRGSRYFVSRR